MSQATTIVFDLPPAVDAAAAAALIAEMSRLPPANAINLNAAAVASVSLGYLQILVSAFKTFPKLTVSAASAEFAETLSGYGIAYPFAEPEATEAPAPPAVVAQPVEIEPPSADIAPAPIEHPAPIVPVEAAPPLAPVVAVEDL